MMHEIDATHRSGLCATTGFFDIKGGFDNVSPSPPRPPNLAWHPIIPCFVVRILSLESVHYSCLPRRPKPLCSSLSGSSARLPHLPTFLCHLCNSSAYPGWHLIQPIICRRLLSNSCIHIIRTKLAQIDRCIDSLTTQGAAIHVPFAPEKTEVIHWETYRQRAPAPLSPIQLGGQLITPSTRVRRLGFWFDQRRTGAVHFQKRAASAAVTSDLSAPSHRQPRALPLRMSAT